MRYIIMCAGNYAEWEYPKQLCTIHGETLIERTVRLLRDAGVPKRDIAITASPKLRDILLADKAPATLCDSKQSGKYWVECFYPQNRPCTYLYGDVVYSPSAIKKIVETETDDIEFFASAPPFAKNYSKNWAEPFAFKVMNQEHFKQAISEVKTLCDNKQFKRHPISWELWQVIKKTPINTIDYTNYTVINDYTCDVDTPHDIEKFEGGELCHII